MENTSKQGWRVIGDKKIYCRSRWEANYARYLEYQRNQGTILEWHHEPQTFWFEKIKRGVRSYMPDFKVCLSPWNHYWVEIKGYMDSKSKTKIKRFHKYYPGENLSVIDSKEYRKLSKVLKDLIPGWEA